MYFAERETGCEKACEVIIIYRLGMRCSGIICIGWHHGNIRSHNVELGLYSVGRNSTYLYTMQCDNLLYPEH
ncbi:hypothetical protein AOV_03415 [Anaplasma ovis str. Haibei]|uniref:Uncharacterized protein n=1 Tax=Anaplasma ovis str. Haibei TaxID=1248439 RepID=A0A2Z2LEM7_9RICK|nr:hypothetical protein AOV_03415 [Anaplasma ovis str. Haibei]